MIKRLIGCVPLLFCASSAWAVGSGGYTNQGVVGAKSLGMGTVFTAVADDLSAIYFNPAGLAAQRGFSVAAGVFPVVSKTDYTDDAGAMAATDNKPVVVPHFYLSAPASERWVLGLGVNSPFGLLTRWKDDGPFRYVATESSLQYVGINPTAAYQVGDRLSVGAGVVYARVSAELNSRLNETALNTLFNLGTPTPSPDGGKALEGDGGGWGYNLGVLFRFAEGQSVGAAYRSAVKAAVKGETRLTGLTDASTFVFGGTSYAVDTETELRFPSSLLLGYALRRGPWTWAADLEWVGYSAVKETRLSFSETDPTRLSVLNDGNPIPRDWNDTWNVGVGANFAFNETWEARGGFYYIPSVVPEGTWDPSLPESSQRGCTLGGTFRHGGLSVDLGYDFVQFGRRTVHNAVGASSLATVNGTYETVAHLFSIGVSWRTGGAGRENGAPGAF